MLTEAGLISILLEQVERHPEIVGKPGLDHVAVADQGDHLDRMKGAEPLDQPEHAALHLDHRFPVRDAAAATETVELPPLLEGMKVGELLVGPIPEVELVQLVRDLHLERPDGRR